MRRPILLVSAVAASAAVWWYFGILLARTDFGTRGTSVANGSLHIMYLACAGAIGLALCVVVRRAVWSALGYAILAAALVPALGFAWLNLSETVCMSKKAGECIALFSKDYALISLLSNWNLP
jgi:hypothetical protein